MSLPDNTNPEFATWLAAQPQGVKDDVDARWDVTATDERLYPGHKSNEYARLTFLIRYCRDEYGYDNA